MLKIATILATFLLSSSVFADPSPYPGGTPPQNAGATNPGGTNNNLGSKATDADKKIKNKKQSSQSSKDEAKMNEELKEQGDDE